MVRLSNSETVAGPLCTGPIAPNVLYISIIFSYLLLECLQLLTKYFVDFFDGLLYACGLDVCFC